MLRPTIFLDIDGVLNTPTTPGFQTPAGKIEPTLVQNLNLIAGSFADGINIVISSHWRMWHDQGTIAIMLHEAGMSLKAYVIGVTDNDYGPKVDDHGAPIIRPHKGRGQEIADWLLDHPDVNADDRWAIIDDNTWMLKSQQSRFVLTDRANGLTVSKAKDVIRILRN